MGLRNRNHLGTINGWALLWELAWVRMKSIHYNSILGIFWSLINPALMLAAMYLVFSKQYGEKISAYPLYLLTGISCVNFFINTTTYLSTIFYQNRRLLLNTLIPHETVLLSGLAVHLVKFLIEILLCVVISSFYGFQSLRFFLLVPFILQFVLFVLGVSIIIAVLTNFAQDISYIWSIATRSLLFLTPIFYTIESLSPGTQKIVYYLNPLTPYLISIRSLLFGDFPFETLVYSSFWTLAAILSGGLFLYYVEPATVERL